MGLNLTLSDSFCLEISRIGDFLIPLHPRRLIGVLIRVRDDYREVGEGGSDK
jgi:hypothetical protein